MPKMLVDADACPVVMREIIGKAAIRTGVETVFVANHPLPIRKSSNIKMIVVASGFDVADNAIEQKVDIDDLVITNDIPLAHDAIVRGALVINYKGERLDASNIKQRLVMRDFYDTLRASGQQTRGQNPISSTDKQQFANAIDRWLAARMG